MLEAIGFKSDGDDAKTATYALERRGLQQDKPEASKGSRAFAMNQLDKETKSFLHKALADVDAALKNYPVEDKKGPTARRVKLLAQGPASARRKGAQGQGTSGIEGQGQGRRQEEQQART